MIARPSVPAPQPWSFPMPAVTRLDNGLTVWAYHLPGQYVASCNLVLELPVNAEPADRDGVATIAVRCLDEGTRTHPGPRFAAVLEEAGAQFDGLVGLSTNQCLLDVPVANLDQGLALLAEAVTDAAYDPADVSRIVANRLSEIEQQESRGSYVASQALRRALIDPALRLSRPIGGRAQDVAQIQADEVARFRDSHYRAEGATLILAGDLTGVDPVVTASRFFGDWRGGRTVVTPEVATPVPPRRRLIHRPGAVQADVRLGWFGIDRADPRWAATQVGLAVMGGTFTSRLNHVLREECGYTYGVSLSAHPYRVGGTIEMVTSTRLATAAPLIERALVLLQVSEPFTEQEVRDAVTYLIRSAPLTYDTAEAVASQAASLAAARLDLDHVTQTMRQISEVTPDDVMAAYRSLIDPAQACVIVVADADQTGDLTGLVTLGESD